MSFTRARWGRRVASGTFRVDRVSPRSSSMRCSIECDPAHWLECPGYPSRIAVLEGSSPSRFVAIP